MEADTLVTSATSGGSVLAAIGGWQLIKWMKGKTSNGNGHMKHLSAEAIELMVFKSTTALKDSISETIKAELGEFRKENQESIRRIHDRITPIEAAVKVLEKQ